MTIQLNDQDLSSGDEITHQGACANRLHPHAGNELEVRYAQAWEALQARGKTLQYLLGKNNEPGVISQHDAEVAATIIQWLGSPVGSNFVRDVVEAHEKEMSEKDAERRRLKNR